MKNHKRSRLLTTLVLAAAMCLAIGSEALAAGSVRGLNRPSAGSTATKPNLLPMAGEPDIPQRAPDPPKLAAPSPSGRSSDWVLRVQWSFRVLLNQLPKR